MEEIQQVEEENDDIAALPQEQQSHNTPEVVQAQGDQVTRKKSSKKVRKSINNVQKRSDGHQDPPSSTSTISSTTKDKASEPRSVTKQAISPVPLALEVPQDEDVGDHQSIMDSSMSSVPPSDFDFLKKKKIIKKSAARGRPKEYTVIKAKEAAIVKANQATRFERQEEMVEKIRQHASAMKKKKQEEEEVAAKGAGAGVNTTNKADSVQDTTQTVQVAFVVASEVTSKRNAHGLRGPKQQEISLAKNQHETDQNEAEDDKEDQEESGSESGGSEDEEAFKQMLLLPTSNNATTTQKNTKPVPPPPSKDPDLTFSQTLINKAKTSDQVACEIKLHQEITVREQQVRRLHELIKILEEISHHFYEHQMRRQAMRKSTSASQITRNKKRSSFQQAQSVGSVQLPPGTASSISTTTTTSASPSVPGTAASISAVAASTATSAAALIMVQQEEAKMKKKEEELVTRTKYRLQELLQVIWCLQETTISIVELLEFWRQLRIKWDLENNRSDQGLHRFLWQGKINYLLKIDQDLKDLFPSLGLMLAIGTNISKAKGNSTAPLSRRGNSTSRSDADPIELEQSQQPQQEEMTHEALADISASLELVYNPLLLTAEIVSQLGLDTFPSSASSKTFMTETDSQQTKNKGDDAATVKHLDHPQVPLYFVMRQVLLQKIGYQSISPCPLQASSRQRLKRLGYCHEVIIREHLLEEEDLQRQREEEEAISQAYDPFTKVQSIAQLDETFNQVLHEAYQKDTTGTSVPLATQLRQRQQQIDKNISSIIPAGSSIGTRGRSVVTCGSLVHVNTKRMRQLMEHKKDISTQVSTASTATSNNKLPGNQLVYRQINRKNVLHEKARKIQLQYLVHRHRMDLLTQLSNFIANVRANCVHIQRIYRGYRGKIRANTIRFEQFRQMEELQTRKCRSASIIQRVSRRFMRRQRAKECHFALAVEFFEDAAAAAAATNTSTTMAERYRRMGEARRKQREQYLQQKRQEQMELEKKKTDASVCIQTCYRGYLARKGLRHLVKEKMTLAKAISVICIQSNIRKFLGLKNAKRMRFHQDLERVNRSAVKIQSIYRGFNSRSHVIEKTLNQEEEGDDEEEQPYETRLPSLVREQQENFHFMTFMLETKAPSPVRTGRAALTTLPRVQLPSLAVQPLKQQQRPPSYSRMELKLKQPSLGDDF